MRLIISSAQTIKDSQSKNGLGVLLFDEADALFGHRTEVQDSHDRYANQEVSYLISETSLFSASGAEGTAAFDPGDIT